MTNLFRTPEEPGKPKAEYLNALLLSVVLAFVVSCQGGNSENVSVNAETTGQSPSLARDEDICKGRVKIFDPAGLRLPVPSNEKKTVREESVDGPNSERITISVTSYNVSDHHIDHFDVPVKLWNGYADDWIAERLTSWEANGRPFKYELVIYPKGIGADYLIFYTDTDGDGTLDTVCQSNASSPTPMPKWLFGKQNG